MKIICKLNRNRRLPHGGGGLTPQLPYYSTKQALCQNIYFCQNIPLGACAGLAAEMLRDLTGAELFKLEPLVRYSYDYNTCIAQDDQRRDARPELTDYPDSLDGYDTIASGWSLLQSEPQSATAYCTLRLFRVKGASDSAVG